jgi:hypothetical protein
MDKHEVIARIPAGKSASTEPTIEEEMGSGNKVKQGEIIP